MSEEFDQPDFSGGMELDCLAKKAVSRWSKKEIRKLQEQESRLLDNPKRLSEYLLDKIIDRARAESEAAAKVLIRASFPIQAFVRSTGHNEDEQDVYSVEGLLSCLPKTININETWIGFKDGSVLMLASPSEETMACARFLAEMSKSPEASSVFGISGDDLGRARELVNLASSEKNVAPLSKEEFKRIIEQKEAQNFPVEASPRYTINMSESGATHREMTLALRQFARNPLDTTAEATRAYLGAVARAASHRDEDGRGKAAARVG